MTWQQTPAMRKQWVFLKDHFDIQNEVMGFCRALSIPFDSISSAICRGWRFWRME